MVILTMLYLGDFDDGENGNFTILVEMIKGLTVKNLLVKSLLS
jgi:hypothetical protein